MSVFVPDPVSRLGAQVRGGWSLSLYESAGEGGGCFAGAREYNRGGGEGPAADPERAAAEAGRRAAGRLRRYCAHNRLNRLGTLTYAGEGCHDPRQARADVGVFFRRLRAGLDGAPLPYVWVPEWHKSGHGLHLHFAVGRFVPRSLIEQAWGHGFVHIKLLGASAGSGSLGEARMAAGYLSKYVAKSFANADGVLRPAGLHRFDVAQGFTPRAVRLTARSRGGLVDEASQRMGARPSRVWYSDQVEGWQGPPALWLQWGGR